MCSIWGGFLSLASILDFQHCTDEAQKAETVLSAVSYIYIHILYAFLLPPLVRTFQLNTITVRIIISTIIIS